jgi:hypothetical protein
VELVGEERADRLFSVGTCGGRWGEVGYYESFAFGGGEGLAVYAVGDRGRCFDHG